MPIYLVSKYSVLSGPFEFEPIPGIGVQLPSNAVELESTLDDPVDGFAWGLVDGKPVQVIDVRGDIFRKEDGAHWRWCHLGPIPETHTRQPFPGEHYVWQDGWVLDENARRAEVAAQAVSKRDSYLRDTNDAYRILQDAADIGRASPEDLQLLAEWKGYRVDLSRIEQQPGFPEHIEWPRQPRKTCH